MDRYADFGVNRGPVEETWGNFLRGSHFKSSSRRSRDDNDSPFHLPAFEPCVNVVDSLERLELGGR
jgi:hypothetical protein